MNPTLISSPLQGLTTFRFRNAFNKSFGGIDTFYAPYFRLQEKHTIKPAYERDILPKNNSGINLIPQIITRDADDFVFAAQYIQQLGYKELNWNLGCPYPMVAKRGMGSGLLKDPTKIDSILKRVYAESDIIVSLKMRLGYETSQEIFEVLPLLDKYPIKNIAIHARTGKQLYKGDLDLDSFQRCIDTTNHTLYFNGDITSVAIFQDMLKRFPKVTHWMIGRGMIADPFLPGMIKNETEEYPENRIELFSTFHAMLFRDYAQALSGATHVIMKMLQFWEYFMASFPTSRKELKKIKKAKSINAYEDAVHNLFNNAEKKTTVNLTEPFERLPTIMQDNHKQQQTLIKLANYRMPFGKYANRLLVEIPERYYIWFANKGFPEGELGEYMRMMLEIKTNGLEYLLTPLQNK